MSEEASIVIVEVTQVEATQVEAMHVEFPRAGVRLGRCQKGSRCESCC